MISRRTAIGARKSYEVRPQDKGNGVVPDGSMKTGDGIMSQGKHSTIQWSYKSSKWNDWPLFFGVKFWALIVLFCILAIVVLNT